MSSPPPLHFPDVMSQTFRLSFGNLRAFFDLALIPTIISVALMIGVRLVTDGALSPQLMGIVKLLDLVPTAMFAVGWYRWLLLGPPQASIVAGLSWSARETGFLREFLVIFGIPIAVMAVFLFQMPDDLPMTQQDVRALPAEVRALGILVPIALVGALIGMRLSFGLAAPAVDMTWRASMAWQYSKGNAMVSLGTVFVVTVIGMIGQLFLLGIATALMRSLVGPGAGLGAALVLGLIVATLDYFKLALVAATQAVIFRQLTGWRPGAALQPPTT
ncbi:MAG: hypothetical protein KF889_23810 [Alphaproteobacteria bacterium]|nr:hypothetical protein [Alphaproteobacteria bacterium]MCW5742805.1 hypothetical protein [Alphaproteobacteria bacterium]